MFDCRRSGIVSHLTSGGLLSLIAASPGANLLAETQGGLKEHRPVNTGTAVYGGKLQETSAGVMHLLHGLCAFLTVFGLYKVFG